MDSRTEASDQDELELRYEGGAAVPGGLHEPPAAMVSPARDIRVLQRHGGATAAELREFLTQLRGKSPAEMLGAVASSNLVRGTAVAAVGTLALLVLATAIPFAFSGSRSGGNGEAPAEPVQQAAAADPAGAPVVETDDARTGEGDEQPATDARTTADLLGVGEERHAPPDVNPLDNALDDLLKDLD